MSGSILQALRMRRILQVSRDIAGRQTDPIQPFPPSDHTARSLSTVRPRQPDSMSFVSILNNDNHPSFAVRPSRPTRHHSSSSHLSDHSHAHSLSNASSHAAHASPGRPRSHSHVPSSQSLATHRLEDHYPSDPVRPPSPGSSVGSLDHPPSSCGSYVPSNPSESHLSTSTASATTTTHRASKTPPGDQPPSPPSSSRRGAGGGGSSSSGVRKNKYPCPYASSHHCPATFTTSGHAARHGKRHTGEKSVLCPICNKAFTRKDNMKQHIRTHRNSTSP